MSWILEYENEELNELKNMLTAFIWFDVWTYIILFIKYKLLQLFSYHKIFLTIFNNI